MAVRGVRGATIAAANSREAILAATHELLTALEDVRAFARSELTETELQTLDECIRAVQRAVKAV